MLVLLLLLRRWNRDDAELGAVVLVLLLVLREDGSRLEADDGVLCLREECGAAELAYERDELRPVELGGG